MAITAGTRLGPYEILTAIGAGGMGEVYRARDTRLDRTVAIKVLASHRAERPERRERFEREARAIAILNHPHICTLYDVGHQDGVDYLVLEYVEGETLAQQLLKGPLPFQQVLQFAIEIADALDKAHRKGITHRDLKPGNIMVTKSGTKLLDFGLAKLAQKAAPATPESQLPTMAGAITGEGTILGTLNYMAPEQIEGKTDLIDARTDIFAFGVVVFEMATGKKAFEGKTQASVIGAILKDDPPPISSLQPMIPRALDRVVKTCLAKDVDDRWQTAGDLCRELKWIATGDSKSLSSQIAPAKDRRALRPRGIFVGVGVLLLVAAVTAAAWVYRISMHGGETIDSVAVLPFVNASGDPNGEYLSDGITESLINSLSQLPHLKVMSRDSAFRYKGKDTDAHTVGSMLGVRAVFKGRVMQRGDNLDISAELVDTRDNSHIWGEQYSRKSSDIFALQGEIAKEITTALRVRLSREDEKRMAKSYTANPEAYQDYLKGRYWWNKRTVEGFNKGIEYFQQAIEKDPHYALAYSGLADCYSFLAQYGIVPAKDVFPRAREASLKALEIDDTVAEAHISLGHIKDIYDWDWLGAEREIQRAIALNPSSADAHREYGTVLRNTGRFEEAIAEHKRAVELDPLSLINNRTLAMAYLVARQYDQVIEQERKTLELNPNFPGAHYDLGMAYLQKSMYKEAIAECEMELVVAPSNYALSRLGYAYAVAGRRAEAQKMLDKLNRLSKQQYVPAWAMAQIYAGLGEKNKAFEWLEKGYEERSIGPPESINVNLYYDSLRSDPRFTDLLRRMNLQQ